MTTRARTRPQLRLLTQDDGERMVRFFYRLSPETVYQRFLTSYSTPDALRPLVEVDQVTRVAVAAIDADGEILGVARYGRLSADPTTAEIAVVVQDSHQGQGLGTELLRAVARLAEVFGVRRLVATTLADNRACLAMLRRVFPQLVAVRDGAQYEIDIDLSPVD